MPEPTQPDPAPDTEEPVGRGEVPRFEIHNRGGGQEIDLTVHGMVSDDDRAQVGQRLLRLIASRQPARLHLDLRQARVPRPWPELTEAEEALADLGGVLEVTVGVPPPLLGDEPRARPMPDA